MRVPQYYIKYIDCISVLICASHIIKPYNEARLGCAKSRSSYSKAMTPFCATLLCVLVARRIILCIRLIPTSSVRSAYKFTAKVVVSNIAQRMFEVESCIRGFHVYGAVWKPHIGENLSCSCEGGNRDPFAVPVQKSSATGVHVPRRISCACAHRGDSTLRHTDAHYALNHGSPFVLCNYDVTVHQMDSIRCPGQ